MDVCTTEDDMGAGRNCAHRCPGTVALHMGDDQTRTPAVALWHVCNRDWVPLEAAAGGDIQEHELTRLGLGSLQAQAHAVSGTCLDSLNSRIGQYADT